MIKVQIQDEAVCILHKHLQNVWIQLISLQLKLLDRLHSLNHDKTNVLKVKLSIQICLIPLKIDPVSHPVCEKGMGKHIYN